MVCMFILPGSSPDVWHGHQQTCLQSHPETSSGQSHYLSRQKKNALKVKSETKCHSLTLKYFKSQPASPNNCVTNYPVIKIEKKGGELMVAPSILKMHFISFAQQIFQMVFFSLDILEN